MKDFFSNLLGSKKKELDKNNEFQKIFSSATYETIVENNYLYSSEIGANAIFSLEEDLLEIQLYNEGVEEYKQFSGTLPFNLDFNMTKKEVNSLLGIPTESQEKRRRNIILGDLSIWDKYIYDTFYLHITYSKKEKIEIVSVGLPL
jgi:hypothetical protein